MPIVDEPLPLPVRWGDEELAHLAKMVRQKSLFYWNGPQTAEMLDVFRGHYALKHCFATSSGSAALHVAVAALRLKPGDEVIVSPITDMGSVIGILYQQAVPVFADLDPRTYNLDPACVRRAITSKTKAIMVVHLAGNPCDMDALMAIAKEHHLAVIEDCAQAWGARHQGTPVGLMGDFGCYSYNDFKHIACGDGGVVGTNNDSLGAGLSKWGDKSYDRVSGQRDPEELAPNYRISEPQSAVAIAQLHKLDHIVEQRVHNGTLLTRLLENIPGVLPPVTRPGNLHTYWFYFFRLDFTVLKTTRADFVAALKAEGITANAGYIPMPVYRYKVFQNHNFFAGTWPIRDFGLTETDYQKVSCPVAEAILTDGITMPLNEAMTDGYLEKVARAIRVVAGRFA